MLQKGLCLFIILTLACIFALVGCLETVKKGDSGMKNNDLEFAVPSTIYRLSVDEIALFNSRYFEALEKYDVIKERENPLIVTGENFNKLPKKLLNHQIPENLKFFGSCFYNSEGYTLESQTGIFASQAILYGNKDAADLGEKTVKTGLRDHFKVVYRKGNLVGVVNMYRRLEPTEEFWELVDSIEQNGFKITKVPPTSEK